ncbi:MULTISPECIES: hypothetical protein [Halomonadaceae]|uniref:hypothetical protein n=1 Tax=Halomonadaceae TaxID=28256 RepID=UPI00200D50B3|nr:MULTISPECIES: hypothetical protein [Halomonas]
MWLILAWSISYSAARGVPLPTVATLSLVATFIFVAWAHRPFRITLQRYRIRRRRTEMLMHIVALPLLLAMLLGASTESLLFPLSGMQKMLLFNILATAGWLVFGITLIVKYLLFRFGRRHTQS